MHLGLLQINTSGLYFSLTGRLTGRHDRGGYQDKTFISSFSFSSETRFSGRKNKKIKFLYNKKMLVIFQRWGRFHVECKLICSKWASLESLTFKYTGFYFNCETASWNNSPFQSASNISERFVCNIIRNNWIIVKTYLLLRYILFRGLLLLFKENLNWRRNSEVHRFQKDLLSFAYSIYLIVLNKRNW